MEEVPRVLREMIPGGLVSIADGDEAAHSGFDGYIAWEELGYYYRLYLGYFDLSGYTREKLSFFIQNVLFQQIGTNQLEGMEATAGVSECRLVTTTPMSQDDFFTHDDATFAVPGNPEGTFSLQQVVRASMLNYQMDLGASMGGVASASTWGLGDSTAAEKLYYARCFRFDRNIHPTGGATYKIAFVPIGVVVPGIALEEDELDYMMRLKRSVDLAKTVD